MERFSQYLAEAGTSYEVATKSGGVMLRARPEVAQLNEAARHAQSLLSEFGLSPATSGKVSVVPAKDEENPFRQFLN